MSPIADVVIFGCGYVGAQVAAAEQGQGRRVAALARSEASMLRLTRLGIDPIEGNLDRPDSLTGLRVAGSALYYFVPPPGDGVRDPRLESLLFALNAGELPQRMVLISTTSIYGDCGGAWVDESRAPAPASPRAGRRLAGEQALARWSEACGVPAVILRVPGIYGPRRLPVERLQAGLPVLREEESPFSNRIQVHDLMRVCYAAMHRNLTPREGEPVVVNASDGHPTTMTDYFYRVADALGLPRPPAISLREARERLSPGMLSYLSESRRLDNRRMRELLGVVPDYPDLESGLRQVAAANAAT